MRFFDVVQAIALDFASQRRACKLIPSQTASARSSMDRASDYGSEGWGFESLRARSGPPRCDPPVGVLHFCQALLRECFFHAHPLVVVPASRFPVRSEMTSAQQRAYLSGGATELAQRAPFRSCSAKNFARRDPSSGVFANKLAQRATNRQFWAIFRAQGELFRARAHHRTEQGELFRAQAAVTWRRCNQWHLCSRKTHPKRPFRTRRGDGGFNPTRARASKGDAGFSPPMRCTRCRTDAPVSTAVH